MTFAAPQSALAVHDDGLFELDGNVINQAAPGDDWNAVFAGTDSAFETVFITDPINGNGDKYFTGGDSKDPSLINKWAWTTVSQPQDKNDIAHAYAAAYDSNGELIVYFGLDRYASNGAAQVGFWFVQGAFGLTGGPTSGAFSGAHNVGDILVQIDFENGGANPQLRVYEWVGSGGDTAGTLDLIASGGSCATTAAGDTRCAIANTSPTNPDWPFDDKGAGGANNDIPAGGMVEGGINLTALGLDDGCFASFIAETRSSPSETSTLSDFANGSFALCAPPTVATQVYQNGQSLGSLGSINVGESVTDVATLTGDKGTVEGTVDFFVCGPSGGTPDCSTGGTKVGATKTLSGGTATSDAFAVNSPAGVGRYCFRVEYTPAQGSKYLAASHTNTTTECFQVIPANVTILKTTSTGTVSAGTPISFTLSWGNSGAGQAKGVVVSDNLPSAGGLSWSISGSTGTGSTCAVVANVLTCNVGTIPGSTPVSGTVTLTSQTTSANCGVIPNTGNITSTNDGSGSSQASVTVQCPDIRVTKTPDAGKVQAGDPAVFTILVENLGPGTATGVTLTDNLPAGYAWTLGGANAGDCSINTAPNPDVLSCSFGTMAAGATKTITLTAPTTGQNCAVIPNTATVDATNEPNTTEYTANNSDSAAIDVLCGNVVIVKTANPVGPVSAGDQIGFDVTVTNNGDGEARGVTITDPLPAGVTWSESPDKAECSIVNGFLTCNVGTLAAGASFTVHVVGTTDSADCALISNTATAVTSNDGGGQSTATVLVQCPNITVAKTAVPAGPVNAGDDIGFDVTISNAGPGVAYGAQASDTLPAYISGWHIVGPANGWSLVGNSLTFGPATLAAGASATVRVVGTTDSADCQLVPNTVTGFATNEPASSQPNTATDDVLVQCPDITVDKTADVTPISAGEPASFTIEVWNAGPGMAYDVTLTDTLPAGVTWIVDATDPAAIEATCDIVGQTLTCDLGDLAPGRGENSVFIYLAGQTSFADCVEGDFELLNTVVVAASNEPANAPLPNSDEATIVVNCPDIGISKESDHGGPVSAGDEVGFTVNIGNTGEGTAFGVSVSDPLPADLVWSLDPGDDRWSLSGPAGAQVLSFQGDLESGEFSSAHITAFSNAEVCGAIPNTATISLGEAELGSDDATELVDCPDVTVEKTPDGASINAGDTASFSIVVTNLGPGRADDVALTDTLPAGTWTLGGPDAEACVIAAGTLTCEFGSLEADETRTVTLSRATTAEDCGPIDNEAIVSADNEAAADTENNSDTGDITVLCAAIDIEKTASAASVVAGDPIAFTVTVTNPGPGDAYGVEVSDPLPATAGLAWSIQGAANGWSIVDGELVFSADVLEAGESVSVTVVSDTTEASCSIVDNSASVTTTNDGSDQASASVEVICLPELTIVKSNDAPIDSIDLGDDVIVDLPTLEEGESATFTLEYTLVNGPVDDGVVTDVLPAGLAYVDGTASSNDEFTFVSYDEATRTLRWEAETVTESGTLSYQAQTQDGAADLVQPLVNVATIDSAQTDPDSDDSEVYVPEVQAVTPPPSITPPPTDTFIAPQAPGNPGFTLMLVLLGLAGFALALGFVTPVPERVRRRDRRS